MDRILITGAGGFVGSHFLPVARQRFPTAQIIATSRDGETGIACDLNDNARVLEIVRQVRPDAIVHLAGQASVGSGANLATWRNNTLSTLHLAEAIAAHVPGCLLLFASSIEVYGAAFNDGMVGEDTLRQPANAYSRSKASCEDLLRDALPPEARLIIARACNHSGAGQDERFVIPSFAAQIARSEAGGEATILVGNLDARRDFLHVDDVVNAYSDLLAASSALPRVGVYNIASGEVVRIADILERLRGMTKVAIEVRPDPSRMRPSDISETRVDASLISETIGWTPHRRFNEILVDVLRDQRDVVSGSSGSKSSDLRNPR